MNCFRSRYRHAMFLAKRQLQLGREESDPLAAVEAHDVALRALRALTRRQRAAIVLVKVYDLTTEEAAVALSIRPGTVRVLISQARARLAQAKETDDG
jgi:DNA-directed RNA polymerase specialized sigma24 family protein